MTRLVRPTPLHRVTSIKLKLSIVIVAAVGVSTSISIIGLRLGWPIWVRPLLAAGFALLGAHFLARGMTRPLREMAAASQAMAKGDYDQRIETRSVDEVGQLAAAFNRMAAQLADLDRERRDLIANVSHELRTPIAGLQATLENLADGVAAPSPETLRTMHAEARRLGRLVADLLDLSRLESGTAPFEAEQFDVAELVDAAVAECRLHHPYVEVTVTVEPGDLRLVADPERLHQVLANLLDNAARQPTSGACPPVVALTAHAGGVGQVCFEVIDAGPGIPLEERERVFERFYRADQARTRDRGGAGLGLAIASWIVQGHGGTITVADHRPRGCRMVVELPADGHAMRAPRG